MKLLLTSNGLCNKSISKALLDLVGKPANETVLSFIPTAMNVSSSDKSWFIRDLNNIGKQGFKFVDIVDISALPKSHWQPRLEAADILLFSGGNSSHLMRWIKESGLKEMLPDLLRTRIYVGISAGSIATNPDLKYSSSSKLKKYQQDFNYFSDEALGLVDFYVRPHLNAPDKKHASEEAIREIAKNSDKKLYAIDDETALRVVDGKVEVISEGKYIKFN